MPVNWQEIDGSKINPLAGGLQMAKDIILIRLYYMTGVWTMKPIEGKAT